MNYKYETIKYNDKLPAKIELCGDFDSEVHWHKEIELIYLCNGKLTVFKNGDEYSLNKGDLFLFNSGEIHQLTSENKEDIEILTLHMSYDFIKSFEKQLDVYSFVVAPGSKAEQELKRLKLRFRSLLPRSLISKLRKSRNLI